MTTVSLLDRKNCSMYPAVTPVWAPGPFKWLPHPLEQPPGSCKTRHVPNHFQNESNKTYISPTISAMNLSRCSSLMFYLILFSTMACLVIFYYFTFLLFYLSFVDFITYFIAGLFILFTYLVKLHHILAVLDYTVPCFRSTLVFTTITLVFVKLYSILFYIFIVLIF